MEQGIDCLMRQYESYSLDGHSINGSFTLLENAADTGGLEIAYQVPKSNHQSATVPPLPPHPLSFAPHTPFSSLLGGGELI